MLSAIASDFRLAVRRLLAAPLFTVFAVLSLALGVGVTTVAYSVVADMFFMAVGVRNPEPVAMVMAPHSGRRRPALLTGADFDELRRSQRSFAMLAASSSFTTALAGTERTELVAGEAVSGEYFRLVGVDAALGRMIQPSDEASRAAVAVLSHVLWRERFASDARVIGRTIRIGGRLFEIVGVAPDSFAGLMSLPALRGTGAWIPLGATGPFPPGEGDARLASERPHLSVLGRRQPTVGIDAATRDVAAIASSLDASNPVTAVEQGAPRIQKRGWTARGITDVHAELTENNRLGIVLAGLVVLVLVVACTNLANLVLARGTTRQHDFVVRRALGAGQWRLIREQLAESVILAIAGGIAAYAVMQLTASVAARDLQLFTGFTLSIRPTVDTATLAVAAGALLVSLVVFGLEPAIRLARSTDVRGPLATSAARMGRVGRYRVLLRWQVSVSTAFFIIAALAVRFVVADLRHDPGLQLDGLVVAQLDFRMQGWDAQRAREVLDRVVEETRRTRAVQAVAVSTGMPFGTFNPQVQLSRTDLPAGQSATIRRATLVAATPHFFSVSGVPILHGRAFDDRDQASAPPVVVVSETAARTLFATSNVIGRELAVQVVGRDATSAEVTRVTIAGVARDTDTNSYMTRTRVAVVYAPLAQRFAQPITIVARATGNEDAAVGMLQAAIRTVDPDVAIVGIGRGWEMLGGPATFLRFAGTSSSMLGALTLILAMVGLYGIQSQGVTLRTREIGVRLSCGATAAQIRRMVLKAGYRPVIEGMAIGLFMGISGRALIRVYLDAPVSVVDPWMVALVPIPLVFAAFCACYLPARRAANIDPTVALRDL
jgi:putative ABC transport system permease protein